MDRILAVYQLVLIELRVALFWIAVVVAVIALVDWTVRTRRVNPFGPIARFSRRFFDPLMRPVERRIVRAGGLPAHAPWWTLAIVVVGGLLLLALLDFLGGFIANVLWGLSTPGRFGVMLLSWAFGILKIALLVRVFSSWFRISPYSRWIRWSYVLTDWFLDPLRRIIPPFGMVDVSPLVAWFLIVLVQRAVGIP
ncbi:MAG TPA: YggT family protein [Gemmatimonadaceae bacterium]|nr:YggT family protein [Gemmatimonadaceae bacterium]